MEQQEKRILDYLKSHEAEIFADLEELVRADSPTQTPENKELIAHCSQVLRDIFARRIGVTPVVYSQDTAGDHLRFDYGQGQDTVMIIGHYDTVWNKGQLEVKREGNKLYGPGVFDMKSGLISALWSLKAYQDLGIDPGKKIMVFCNSDDETGSKTSTPIIKDLAKDCKAVLICEPSEAVTGKLKTARKGGGGYTVTVHGKASHAGNDHKGGINAIEEMARQIQYVHTLTDYDKGTTLSVGICSGGTKTNIVPDFAQFKIDTRYSQVSEAERIYGLLHAIKPSLPGATVEVEGKPGKMPMERTPGNVALYEKALEAGKALDMELDQCMSGGGSDGNTTSAMGIPTLDGLGAVGEGLHAINEHIYIDQYIPRIALLASFMTRI